jgi:hypothetical protein
MTTWRTLSALGRDLEDEDDREACSEGPLQVFLKPWPAAFRPVSAAQRYSMRRPEIARLITSCWICSVPSKMS